MAIIITPNELPVGKVGTYYEQYISAAGGTAPYSYTLAAGTLPPGLSLGQGSGALFGTPEQGGVFNFTVEVIDSENETATKDYSVTVESLVISPGSGTLPLSTLNEPYSQVSTATNAVGSCSWAQVSGSLPPGLAYNSLANDFVLSGTPTQAGNFSWTIAASDESGQIGTAVYSLVVGLQILPTNTVLPSGTTNQSYSASFTALGNSGNCTWSVVSGAMPPGLSIGSSSVNQGTLSGTVSAAGNWNFTVAVTDEAGIQGRRSYSIQTSLGFDPETVPVSVVNQPYSQVITALGGFSPYDYNWIGNLPPGLSFTSTATTATISGTPTLAGTYTGTLEATDNPGNTGFKSYTFVTRLNVVDGALPNGKTGNDYSYTLQAQGGTAPYTWQLVSGSLPPGLTLSNGAIVGEPTTYGSYSFELSVVDDHSPQNSGSGNFTIDVELGFIPGSLSNRTVGFAFSDPITVQTASTGPFAFSISSGTLPSGVTLVQDGSETCIIQGTPTVIGDNTFTLSVEDTVTGEIGSQEYTLRIVTADLIVVPLTLPEGVVGTNYSVLFETTGGVQPYNYAIVQGTLPSGLTLSNSGLLSGIPTASVVRSITLEVIDSLGSSVRKTYPLAIAATALRLTSDTTLPPTKQGVSYSTQITAAGGFTPYSYSIVSGRLPTGLTLSSSGTISGIPTAQGVFLVTIRVSDPYGATATANFSLSVERNEIEVLPVTIPLAREGVEYSVQFEASGATPPYTFSLYAGTLPYGLTLSSSGLLAGTPTLEGIYQFIIEVTAEGVVSTRTYQLVVYPVAPDQALIVTVGGIPQKLGVDYTILSRDPVSIQFVIPPPEGVIVEMKVYRGHTWTDPGSHTDGSETLTYYGPLEPDRTYSSLNSEINTQ